MLQVYGLSLATGAVGLLVGVALANVGGTNSDRSLFALICTGIGCVVGALAGVGECLTRAAYHPEKTQPRAPLAIPADVTTNDDTTTRP